MSEWISVKTKIPEIETHVLACDSDSQAVVFINKRGEWDLVHKWDCGCCYDSEEVDYFTHWMPLPPLPVGEQ